MSEYKRLTNPNIEEYNIEIDFCTGCPYHGEPNGCNREQGECGNYERFCEMYDRLSELEDKIGAGTLVELPCYKGQTVYIVDDYRHEEVWKGICDGVEYKRKRAVEELYVYATFEDEYTVRPRVFTNKSMNELCTTREAAEARLKELKGEEK